MNISINSPPQYQSCAFRAICLLLLTQLAYCQPPPTPGDASNATALICVPFGTCESCPDDSVRATRFFSAFRSVRRTGVRALSYTNRSANPSATAASSTVSPRHPQAHSIHPCRTRMRLERSSKARPPHGRRAGASSSKNARISTSSSHPTASSPFSRSPSSWHDLNVSRLSRRDSWLRGSASSDQYQEGGIMVDVGKRRFEGGTRGSGIPHWCVNVIVLRNCRPDDAFHDQYCNHSSFREVPYAYCSANRYPATALYFSELPRASVMCFRVPTAPPSA